MRSASQMIPKYKRALNKMINLSPTTTKTIIPVELDVLHLFISLLTSYICKYSSVTVS